MSVLDVALRLRLDDRLSGPARKVVDGLRGIDKAAAQLGRNKGGRGLADSLNAASPAAQRTRRDLTDIARKANELRAIDPGRGMTNGLGRVSEAAKRADREVGRLGRTTNEAGRKMGQTAHQTHETAGAFGMLERGASRAWGALLAFAAPAAIIRGLDEIEARVTALDRKYAAIAVTAEMRDPAVAARLRQQDTAIGIKYGMTPAEVQPLRAAYVAGGMTLEQAQALTDPSAKGVKAMDASPENIAQTIIAGTQNLKITDQQVPLFLDMVAKGTKLGRFEADSVAKFMPQFASAYQGMGYTGLPAAAEINAMAQVVRMASPTPDAAGTNLGNLFQKVFSQDAVKNFKEKGINLSKVRDRAKKEGKSYVRAILEEVDKVTKGGDPFKVGELFGDAEVLNALRALLPRLQQLDDWTNVILKESAGTLDEDWAFLKNTPAEKQAKLDAIKQEGQDKAGASWQPVVEAFKAWQASVWNPTGFDALVAPDRNARHIKELDKFESTLGWDEGGRRARERVQKRRAELLWERADKGWGLDPMPGGGAAGAPFSPSADAAAQAGAATGKSWRDALGGELGEAKGEVAKAVAELTQMLSFTARPTIAPQIQMTPGGGATVKPMSLDPADGPSAPRQRDARVGGGQQFAQNVTFHITGGDPEATALAVERRLARLGNTAGALYDTA